MTEPPRPAGILVPIDRLDVDTLRRLVAEFVTRQGTDYGAVEATLERKVDDVLRQLRRGEAAVVWDPESETTSVVLARDLPPDAT